MRDAGADHRTNDGRDLGMGQELRDPGFDLVWEGGILCGVSLMLNSLGSDGHAIQMLSVPGGV